MGVASLLLQSCTLDWEPCSSCHGSGKIEKEVGYHDYALEYSTRNFPRWCRPSATRTYTESVECSQCGGLGGRMIWNR